MAKEQQIDLPYQALGKTANRDQVRTIVNEAGGKLGRQTYYIPFSKIQIREGFNKRMDYGDIEELANSILSVGLNEPLTVDIELESGIAFVEMGHRRYQAIDKLVKAAHTTHFYSIDLPGLRLGNVECFVNQATTDELTRIARQYSSNKHKEYTVLENAHTAQTIKRYYEKTNEDIAQIMGCSRQSVDNYLLIAEQPDDVKQSIKDGDLSLNQALKNIRDVKQAIRKADKKQEDSGKTSSRYTDAGESPDKVEMPSQTIDESLGSGEEGDEEERIVRTFPGGEEQVLTHSPIVDGAEYLPPYAGDGKPSSQDAQEFLDKSNPDAERKEEYQLCNRVIGNLDKLDNMASFLPKQAAEDMQRLIAFIQKDMEPIREYVKKCTK